MKIQSVLLSFIAILFSAPMAFAHGSGHGGAAISEGQALSAATESVAMIINQKVDIQNAKLDASWNTIPASNKAIYKKGNGYFIISLNNKVQGKTLYVLLSDQGEFFEANYSGKFENLEE